MTEPSSSRPWADVPTRLNPDDPFGSPSGRLLVSSINPVYLHYADTQAATTHWKQLIFSPETLRAPGERYVPGQLVTTAHTATFGPFGAVITAPEDVVYQGEHLMAYDPRYISGELGNSRLPKPAPDPEHVLSRNNEVMIRRGEHVGIAGFFASYLDDEPIDPIGASIAEANAERLGVPLLRLPVRPPQNVIGVDIESGRIRVVHEGFNYTLHDPRYPDNASWEGGLRPCVNYEVKGFPDTETAATIVTSLWRQTGQHQLTDELWERYLLDRDRRMVPQLLGSAVALDRGYGRATKQIVIYSDATARRYRARDAAVIQGWEGVENLFAPDSATRSTISRMKRQLGAGAPVPPDEVVSGLAEATEAAERTGNPAYRATALLAGGFYRNALDNQRGVIGMEHVFPTGDSSDRPESPPPPASKPAAGLGRRSWLSRRRGGGRGGGPNR